MTNNTNLAAIEAAENLRQPGVHPALATKAIACARALYWVPGKTSEVFAGRLKRLNLDLLEALSKAQNPAPGIHEVADEQRWLFENRDFLRGQLATLDDAIPALSATEQVRIANGKLAPRALVIAESMLGAVQYRYDDSVVADYLTAFQTVVVLRLGELSEIAPALKLVLLEQIAARATNPSIGTPTLIGDCVSSLHEVRQAPWPELLESLIVFDQELRQDPAGAYSKMDSQTRERYREEVVKLAKHSDHTELEIAQTALALAKASLRDHHDDPRLAQRESHVGYYLIAEGRDDLYRRANVRLPWRDRYQAFLRRYPDEFYPLGVEALTLGMILAILWTVRFNSLTSTLIAVLLLAIPCSQSAVEIMNFLTTALLDPDLLPKLDFAGGVPEECATMVVVPTLLLNEKQVRETVRELEVRYVGNMSANVHFALLTDLADAAEQPNEDDPLVDLCGSLVQELNRKYAGKGAGTFAMFHRHRIYNRREGVWIGWERKRGKLLDFNKLVLGEQDSFPYKVGDLSILPKIRYILTLDSDTQLPRGAAHRLIGAMAHPLCQAIIDRKKNIVVKGYGILQPRVGISVQSTSRSRLAAIFSDWTGLDIYSQAVSDVYQDLYGEGSFVGKGLYELRTIQTVLDGRFPRNQILSHDLIEGAYTRAGLATDVKVIDSYPSHYSAYARRKHRWVRGDWQNVEWLLSKVPNESGRWVPNPLSIISRWKIMDNLRRSMVEPVTVGVFIIAWVIFPGRPSYWTFTLLAILFAPTVFQFLVNFFRTLFSGNFAALKDVFESLIIGVATVLLSFAFRIHDALLSADAIWRSLYRRFVSRQRLLQWETAAEAEAGKKKRTTVELYLLWTPAIAFGIGIALYYGHRVAMSAALPILAIWGLSSAIPLWLDRPPREEKQPLSRKDDLFVRRAALRTWRYFAEFSTAEHNWLVPDNVQADPPQIAGRVSTTNLGLLLNARQIACELGYITVPEFVDLTRRTLDSMSRMPAHRGHLFNWYDTRTLAPLPPRFISSVDSGNLAASLITLAQGSKALLTKPLLSEALLDGYDDYLRALGDVKALSASKASRAIKNYRSKPFAHQVSAVISGAVVAKASPHPFPEASWLSEAAEVRRIQLQTLLAIYMPWLLPEFELLRRDFGLSTSAADLALSKLPSVIGDLQSKLQSVTAQDDRAEDQELRQQLLTLLGQAQEQCTTLIRELNQLSSDANAWFENMDFSFLLDQRRKLLSIGYDAEAGKLHSACYDLLASEARIAAFVAIAKGDIPREAWLKLGRKHVATIAGPALVSWAGTMFEYLMPPIFMHSYRDSTLQCAMDRVVKEQQAYAAKKGVPWGMSESGYSELNADGVYGYRFFGIPDLALQSSESERVVIAPYATVMALTVDTESALDNLRRMTKLGWFGDYGFYESADFGPAESPFRRPRLVKSWMVHHQGMSLLAMANLLRGNIVQQWFHSNVYVQATELLLQERMIIRRASRPRRSKRNLPARSAEAS